mmetsp:Transcript_60678/g.177317  ORF Transcript_60678/g.177317 Transcript_60678/m.177317 type:complete len:225 (-) Transcript_60678:183-857(-)
MFGQNTGGGRYGQNTGGGLYGQNTGGGLFGQNTGGGMFGGGSASSRTSGQSAGGDVLPASLNPSAQMQQKFMKKMWETRSFADLSITCCDGSVQAHRCVISAASPVFARMLSGDMQEAQNQIVELADCHASAVEAALCFIYTGESFADTDFSSVLSFAHKYEVEELIRFSAQKLSFHLSSENVVGVIKSMRPLTNHREVEAAFQVVLRKIRDDSALLEVVARDL